MPSPRLGLFLLFLAACGGPSASDPDGGPPGPDAAPARGAPGTVDSAFGPGGTVALPSGVTTAASDGAGGALLFASGFQHLGATAVAPAPVLPASWFERLIAIPGGGYYAVHNDYYGAPASTVARLTAGFAFDPSFAVGTALADFHPADATVAPDGSVFVVGTAKPTGTEQIVIEKLDATGAPVPGFGVNGRATSPPELDLRGSGIARLADGALIARCDDGFTPCLARFTAAGALDPSFGVGGILRLAALGPRYGRALAVDRAGGLLVLGMTNNRIQIARVLVDGQLDPAFGAAGVASIDVSKPLSSAYDESIEARSLTVAGDGTLVVTADYSDDVGNDGTLDEQSILVIRFDAAGAIDPRFGVAGSTRVPLGAAHAPSTNAYGGAAVELADHRLLIGGSARVGNTISGGATVLWL
jgi:uncharacterized delta-60 repeat protein